METFNDREIEAAINSAVDNIIEQVLWYLADEQEMDRDRATEIISESDGSDTAAIGLDLGQMLSIVDEGAHEYGYDELSFSIDSLRSQLESHAAMFIHLLAENRTREIFDELFDFMDEHDLEPEQMREDNDLGCFLHVAEREKGLVTVYAYRNVEDRGNHIDIWEYRLAKGWCVYFRVQVEG